jgi:hypothetical protein
MEWASRTLINLALEQLTSLPLLAASFGVSRGQLRLHLDRCLGSKQ